MIRRGAPFDRGNIFNFRLGTVMNNEIVNGKIFYKAYISNSSHIGGYWKDGLPVEFTQEQLELIGLQPENEQEEYALKLKGE